MSIQKITFKGILDHLATKKSRHWLMTFQASQFNTFDFEGAVTHGQLNLNLGPDAIGKLELYEDSFSFACRRHGITHHLTIPYTAIMFIKDPDTSEFYQWPYYLDHGDDAPYVDEDLVDDGFDGDVNYIDFNNPLTPEQLSKPSGTVHPFMSKADLKKLQESLPGLFNANGAVDILNLAKHATRLSTQRELTIAEKVGLRSWAVIEGGKTNTPASIPHIDEIHRAKQAKRELETKLAKVNLSSEPKEIRSDGSDGKSVFFPDLDVSKCYFPTRKTARPEWLTVITGSK